MPDNQGRRRCARYSRKKGDGENVERSAVILAHVGRTPKGKIRLKSVGIVLGRNSESLVSKVSDLDPRFVFETSYGVRKVAHDVVKKSGKFSRFHDSIVKVVYDDL